MAQERINLILQHLCLPPSSLSSLHINNNNNNNNININNNFSALFNIEREQQTTIELKECKGKEEVQSARKLLPKDFYNFQYKDYHEFRSLVMKHFEEGGYYLSPDLQSSFTLPHLRQFALEKVQKLQSQKYISVWDIKKEPKKFFAVIESYAGNQLGVALKFSLTYLFLANSIIELGTEKHYRYLEEIEKGEIFGCFALAEIGHGSNIRALETTAIYDKATEEFVIHSPTSSSYKSWISGAGDHASHAVVFCQLFIDDQCFGLHPFIVQLRDGIGGAVREGIVISDVGLKEGLNTLDNAYIQFIHHRIPRDGLLDRYGQVTGDGEYHSNTTVGERFIIQYSTFLPTKLFIGAQSLAALKTALSVALRYAHKRRQFGVGEREIKIINFNYTRLVPLVATSFALTSFYNAMKEMYEKRSECCRQKQQAFTAALKVFSSWEAIEGLQICRECCGAQGYLVQNLISSLRNDIDAYVTIDGDNQTLLQQISRYLLDNLQRKFKRRGAEMEYMKDRMNYLLFEKHFQGRTADVASIMSAEFQLKAMKIREERIMFTLAGRLKKKLKKSSNFLEAWNKVLDHVHSLATSFIHRIVLKCFISDINHFDTTDNTKYYLSLLRSLFALKIIESDPWFFTSGHLTPSHLILIRKQNAKICKQLKGHVLDLCDSFAVSKELLKKTIARDEKVL